MSSRMWLLAAALAAAGNVTAQSHDVPADERRIAGLTSMLRSLRADDQGLVSALAMQAERTDSRGVFSDEAIARARRNAPATQLDVAGFRQIALRLEGRNLTGHLLRILPDGGDIYPVCPACGAIPLSPSCRSSGRAAESQRVSQFVAANGGLLQMVAAIYGLTAGGAYHAGTAFVAGARIVTAWHVVSPSLGRRGDAWMLKPGSGFSLRFGDYVNASAQSVREVRIPQDTRFRNPANTDLAVFDAPGALVRPFTIPVAAPQLGVEVVVAGYPTDTTDTDMTSTERILRVFGACGTDWPRSKLALAPGSIKQIAGGDAAAFGYSSNTLGNNSGSPIFRLSDGALIGVHTGESMTFSLNQGLAAAVLLQHLASVPKSQATGRHTAAAAAHR